MKTLMIIALLVGFVELTYGKQTTVNVEAPIPASYESDPVSTGAAGREFAINLWFKDGKSSKFSMNGNTVMKFVNEELVLSNNSETLSVPLSDLQRWTYSQVETSIDEVDANSLSVKVSDGNIVISNLPIGTKLYIYRVDGVLKTSMVSHSVSQVVSMSSWTPGIYIVKCGEVSFKIQKP